MDDDRRAEIAELRRRVFGPGRDPADTAALARLRELEGREAGGAAVPGPSSNATAPARGRAASPPDRAASSPPAEQPRPPRRPRIRRRIALLWVGSLVAVAVASAGITAWSLDADRGTLAVLALDLLPAPDNATYLSVDTGSVVPGTAVADFHGLTVARVPAAGADTASAPAAPSAWSVPAPGVPSGACLTVGASNPDGSVDGPSECGAGSVFARVLVVVASDSPQELRDAYPLGTTLVFEDEGGPVRVRLADG
ncbi:hypothetical protein ABID70_002676 [Clavibacter michiganensis]|uniref:hypothetical protein n=1 Tax=Clavibacter michiganensis TaxID=28447 RepID=UPI001AE3EBE4|nr:hypothetical protein [Clavibacter michiganensis]MBP2457150.1 hypothetical protein [Clavibacter michiganensis]MDQ0409720.1 hypothetical protein [Clavibacter michiganensis]